MSDTYLSGKDFHRLSQKKENILIKKKQTENKVVDTIMMSDKDDFKPKIVKRYKAYPLRLY